MLFNENSAQKIAQMLQLQQRMFNAQTEEEITSVMEEFKTILQQLKEDVKTQKENMEAPSFIEELIKDKGLTDYGVGQANLSGMFTDSFIPIDFSQMENKIKSQYPEMSKFLKKELEDHGIAEEEDEDEEEEDPMVAIIDQLIEVNDKLLDQVAPKEETEYLHFPADFNMPTDHAGVSTHVPSDEEVQEVVTSLQDELVEEGETVVARKGTITVIKIHDETGVHYIVADNPFYAHVEK